MKREEKKEEIDVEKRKTLRIALSRLKIVEEILYWRFPDQSEKVRRIKVELEKLLDKR